MIDPARQIKDLAIAKEALSRSGAHYVTQGQIDKIDVFLDRLFGKMEEYLAPPMTIPYPAPTTHDDEIPF